MQFKDYYAALGLSRSASADEIKQAYRRLARKYHPDVSQEAGAEARFKEISEAYEALSDPERRATYDRSAAEEAAGRSFRTGAGRAGFDFKAHGFPGKGFDFENGDVFGAGTPTGSFFDALNKAQSEAAAASGIDPKEFANFRKPGSGGRDDFFEFLFGRRATASSSWGLPGADLRATLTLNWRDAYLGAQRVLPLDTPVTGALGRPAALERPVEVRIPKGVRPGQQLRLAGQGSSGQRGSPAGDLIVEIAFASDADARVDGADLYLDVPVSPWEAALGGSVPLVLPDRRLSLSIPAASTSGRKLRLKGLGLPGDPAGDLYAVLKVHVPAADTPQAQAAYQALADACSGFLPPGREAG